MTKTEDYEQVEVTNAAQLRDWLEANHAQDASIWLVTWKKDAAPQKYVSREEVLDEILCFGWIDGIRRKLDDTRTMQLLSRRKTQHWAKSYKDRVAKLTEEGRMHESGLRSVEEAKKSGLWTFMDDVDALIVPDDLRAALVAHPPAEANFDAMAPSYRRNVLRWVKLAKTPATREKRIAEAAKTSRSGDKIPQM
ncbi:YdeI family protein [Pseudahrensia aquimaris]|uniref:YdeI family protein n=1 Tax=Pseudahrensia aquimaris TaxID=744461 RepID=A0ABW3FAN6_9HYPH